MFFGKTTPCKGTLLHIPVVTNRLNSDRFGADKSAPRLFNPDQSAMKKKSKPNPKNCAAERSSASRPTETEQAKLGKTDIRRADLRLRVQKVGDQYTVGPAHPDRDFGFRQLMEAFGTSDPDFLWGLITQMVNATGRDGIPDEASLNFMSSVVIGIKPTDHVEAMLAVQMAAMHIATTSSAELLYRTTQSKQQEVVGGVLNKCARTFSMQTDTLKRYRTGGQQTVTVQHVNVAKGGQAIVGPVTQAGSKTASKGSTEATLALTDARQPAMPTIDVPARGPVGARRREAAHGR